MFTSICSSSQLIPNRVVVTYTYVLLSAMKFSSLVVVILFLFVNQTAMYGNIVVSEPEIDGKSVVDERIDDIQGQKSDDGTSNFESMTIVASVDGRLHGFDANNNKKWTSDSSGPLSSHHSSGNALDFSGDPSPLMSLSHFLSITSISSHLSH